MGIQYQQSGTMFVHQGLMCFSGKPALDWLLRECVECDYQRPEMCRDAYPETASTDPSCP
jgi:hypothetical protein